MNWKFFVVGAAVAVAVVGCGDDTATPTTGDGGSGDGGAVDAAVAKDPNTASIVAVDRFSDGFAHLFRRSANAALPAPNAPIDFDQEGPFVTHGFGPRGGNVTYYNFDVLPAKPAPIFVLFRDGESTPVPGQLNIVDVVPGDPGYNDFWQVMKVTVPKGYVANAFTSLAELRASGATITSTPDLVNCPVVPDKSSAKLRFGASESRELQRGWYKNKVVTYFTFSERPLAVTASGEVPVSDIYVTFAKNPSDADPSSGPASGFRVEAGTTQTHNVPETLPTDATYSPYWDVNIYDNGAFSTVADLASAKAAPLLKAGAAQVNCPIVQSK